MTLTPSFQNCRFEAKRISCRLAIFCFLIGCLTPQPAAAYETDQYTNRGQEVLDSTAVMNNKVNETIRGIAAGWSRGRDEMAFVNAVYRRIGGLHWVDKLERWAMKSPHVDKLETPRYGSVYAGHPPWAMRVTSLFGVGKTIRLNNELIGSDKIGHFLSQGRKFYKRYRRLGSERKASRQSVFTEKAIFGSLTTGSFSNADLVANFEGYRFYRSLFEDDIVPGKPAILRWQDGVWIVQRNFDWADHVNAFWDEALNPNHFGALARKHIRKRLVSLCDSFWLEPHLYLIENRTELAGKYAHIGLIESREFRLDVLCTSEAVLLAQVVGR